MANGEEGQETPVDNSGSGVSAATKISGNAEGGVRAGVQFRPHPGLPPGFQLAGKMDMVNVIKVCDPHTNQ